MFNLKGKVAVVSGASSGLGAQMAKALAGQGADLVILARRKEKLEEVKKSIETLGVRCLPVVCDVTIEQSVIDAARIVKEEFSKVDILINNAGSGATIPIEETTMDEWMSDFKVDVNGVFLTTREFGKLMIENKYGRIINIASMYGLVGNTALPSAAYHAAKGAVVNFTRATAAEWAKYGINANAICPGYFATELTEEAFATKEFQAHMEIHVPLGRNATVEEISGAAIFLSSEEASYVTGAILPVDGGYTAV